MKTVMNLVFLGAPGAGKGTQATRVCDRYGIPHISTGDILRANIKAGTPLGVEAKTYIDKGLLVPDDVVIGLVEQRIGEEDCKNGYLLDGFPRTLEQAEALSKFSDITYAINIQVDSDMVIDRIAGRRMCKCGESYHISWYNSDKCQKCGSVLYQRDDDKEDTVKARLEVYEKQTAPLIDYYNSKGALRNVHGKKGMEEVFEDIAEILG